MFDASRGALGATRAHERVKFVNEENNLPFRPFHFFHHILHPLFKLAAIFCAGNHESEVKRQKLFALQHFGNIACRHARGESFGNRRLPHARLADKHRIVLGATRENLNNSINFYIAADNRVKLVFGGEFGEITCVLGERAETLWLRGLPVFRGLKLFQDGDRGVAAYSEACENVCGRARMFNDGEEEICSVPTKVSFIRAAIFPDASSACARSGVR